MAKFGVINLKGLADPLIGKVEITVDLTNTGGGISITQNGVGVPVSGSFSGNKYIIPSLAYGSYQYKFGMPGPIGQPCFGPSANLSHYSATTRTTYVRFTCGGTPPVTGSCGGQTCSATQHCNSLGYCVNNCTSTSCPTGQTCNATTKECQASTNGTYKLQGYVKDSVTNNFLSGVSVGGVTTGNDGKYTIPNLPITSAGTQSFTFHKDGYTDQTKTLQQLGINPNTIIAGQTTPYIASLTNLVIDPVAIKFSLIGAIRDSNNALVSGVTVKISCVMSCGKGPWSGTSTGAQTFNYLTNTTSGLLPSSKEINFRIDDIYNFKNDSSIEYLKVEFTKSGYYFDANKNSQNDDSTVITRIDKSSIIKTQLTASSFTYVSDKNAKLVQIPQRKFDLAGSIKLYSDFHPGITIKISKKNSPLEELGSTQTTSAAISGTNYPQINYVISDINENPDGYIVTVVAENYLEIKNLGYRDQFEFLNNQISWIGNHGAYRKDIAVEPRSYYSIHVDVLSRLNLPIPNADVSIFVTSCPIFKTQTQKTSVTGDTTFANHELYRLMSGKISTCSRIIHIRVSSPGFTTQETFVESGTKTIYLDQAQQSSVNEIKGKVLDQDMKPISGATVYSTTARAVGAGKTTTAADGSFSFKNVRPNTFFLISAFHKDYIEYREDWGYAYGGIDVSVGTREVISVILRLRRINVAELNLVNTKFQVIDSSSYKPIELAEVKLTDKNNNITKKVSDKNGLTDFDLIIGDSYTIQGKKGSVENHFKFAIPSNWKRMSHQEQASVRKATIIFLNLSANLIGDFKFKIVDESNNPLSEALIIIANPAAVKNDSDYSININREIPDYYGAKTNTNGIAQYSYDFGGYRSEYYSDLYDLDSELVDWGVPSPNFEAGQTINLIVIKKGYEANQQRTLISELLRVSNNQEIIISLRSSKGTISIVDEGILTQREVRDVILEKYNPSKKIWEDTGLKPTEGINRCYCQGASIIYVFSPKSDGRYRGTVRNTVIYTPAGNFTQGDNIELEFDACLETDNPKVVKDFGDGITFVYVDKVAVNLSTLYSELFKRMHNWIAELERRAEVKPLIVIFRSDGQVNASAYVQRFDCLGKTNSAVMTINTELIVSNRYKKNIDDVFATISHEYGHLYYNKIEKSQSQFANQWHKLFRAISDASFAPCIFSRIKDSNVGADPNFYSGHPEDADSEMFASFFSGYINHHQRLFNSISSLTSVDGFCQNTLGYMWQMFSENVTKMQASDTTIWDPVGGTIGNKYYDFDQIAKGYWRNSIYKKLSNVQKVRQQVTLLKNRLDYVFSNIFNISTINTVAIRLNNEIQTLLESIGIKFTTEKLTGTVTSYDDEPMPGIKVTTNDKYAISQPNGTYQITGLQRGPNTVKFINPRTGVLICEERIKVTNSATQIVNCEILDGHYAEFHHFFKGEVVYKSGMPLNNGQVILKNIFGASFQGKITNGNFDIQKIFEEQYSVTIKDGNGTEHKIVDIDKIYDPAKFILDRNFVVKIIIE